MLFPYPTEWPQYYTAAIRARLPLLATDKYKAIITDSLYFMVKNKRLELNAFAPTAIGVHDHIHLIWQPLPGHSLSSIQLSFMKFTAQKIKLPLSIDNPLLPEQCKVNKSNGNTSPDGYREETETFKC